MCIGISFESGTRCTTTRRIASYTLAVCVLVSKSASLKSQQPPKLTIILYLDLDVASIIFGLAWLAVLWYILYSLLKSCFRSRPAVNNTRRPGSGPSGSSPRSGWYSSYRPDDYNNDAPPPYSKHPNNASQAAANPAWRPDFWTGAALGGLGAYLFSNNARRRETPATTTSYDWEHERQARMPRVSPVANPGYTSQRRSFFSSDDRGEGSSNLGSMRRSTGLGGSSVR